MSGVLLTIKNFFIVASDEIIEHLNIIWHSPYVWVWFSVVLVWLGFLCSLPLSFPFKHGMPCKCENKDISELYTK